jgi:hypothetical protein
MRRLQIALTIILGFSLPAIAVRGQTIDENQFTASFLFNIAKFVEWPAESFKGPADPLVCCVLGEGPFDQKLEQAAGNQSVDKRRLVMRHVFEARQLNGCHMLFVSAPERKRWLSMADSIKGHSILTVGEIDNFISEGGIISFSFENAKPLIQINMDEAIQEKLRISSKLLNLSQIVRTKK